MCAMTEILSPSRVRFGTFELDLESHQLRKQGTRIRIEHKAYQILELLLANAGRVVSRKMLRDKLWPHTHVNYAHNLNTAVSKLRELLGDSAQCPRYIETLPRVGYRFISPVRKSGPGSSAGDKHTLVVLPFENLSGNAEHEYFADGLTEELICHLGQLNPGRLAVIARSSAIRCKAMKKNVAEIASELHADYILEGSVRVAEARVRITAQLIEVQEETHLWSSSYDGELRDILNVQADVARRIASALNTTLLEEWPAVPSGVRGVGTACG